VARSCLPKKVSLQLSSEQSVGDVWIVQVDRKRVPEMRFSGCISAVAITVECSRSCMVTVHVQLSMCDCILKVCEHDILQTAHENFTKFTAQVQFRTKVNCLDFEVKKSKVKVTASFSGGGILSDGSPSKTT